MAKVARKAEKEKILNRLEQKYDEVAKDTGSELLVLIPIKEREPFSFTAAVLTRMDQDCAIQKAQGERPSRSKEI